MFNKFNIALMSTEYQLNVNRMSSFFSTKSTSENRIKKFRHFFIVKLFTKKRFNLNNLKSIQSNHDTNERILFTINNNNSLLWQTLIIWSPVTTVTWTISLSLTSWMNFYCIQMSIDSLSIGSFKGQINIPNFHI